MALYLHRTFIHPPAYFTVSRLLIIKQIQCTWWVYCIAWVLRKNICAFAVKIECFWYFQSMVGLTHQTPTADIYNA